MTDKNSDVPTVIDKLNLIGKVDNRIITKNFSEFSKNWSPFVLDWYFCLISQSINRTNTIKIPVKEVRRLMLKHKHTHETIKNFVKRSDKALNKILDVKIKFEQEQGNHLSIITSHIFSDMAINTDLDVVFRIRPEAESLFCQLQSWTRFALESFTRLNSGYSKKLFVYLKEFRVVGRRKFTTEEFRKDLNVPKSYRNGAVVEKVITPAIESLAPYFKNLNMTTIRSHEQGRRVIGYLFTFTPEAKNAKDIIPEHYANLKAMNFISTNPYLSKNGKYRAYDKFKGLKIGTSKKLAEKQLNK